MGDFDPSQMQDFGGNLGEDSDDEDGLEATVDPYVPQADNIDDLDGEEEADLKK